MAGAIQIVIRGRLLGPLAALNERMSALVAGTDAAPADAIETYCYELKTLAKNYEELRRRSEP